MLGMGSRVTTQFPDFAAAFLFRPLIVSANPVDLFSRVTRSHATAPPPGSGVTACESRSSNRRPSYGLHGYPGSRLGYQPQNVDRRLRTTCSPVCMTAEWPTSTGHILIVSHRHRRKTDTCGLPLGQHQDVLPNSHLSTFGRNSFKVLMATEFSLFSTKARNPSVILFYLVLARPHLSIIS